MNLYFPLIWVPLHLLAIGVIIYSFYFPIDINWTLVFVSWFLLGPVGLGTGFHRLFSHRQFKTYKPIEYILGILGTFAGYAPILYFVSEHMYHHQHADTRQDIQAGTKYGWFHAFFSWRLKKDCLKCVNTINEPSKKIVEDKFLMFLHNYFVPVFWLFFAFTSLFGIEYMIAICLLPVIIEHNMLNLVNLVCHYKTGPLSYRNFSTKDSSSNNVIVGFLTFGRGWHNNHHAQPLKLINHKKWWEIDVEGLIGKLLSRNA